MGGVRQTVTKIYGKIARAAARFRALVVAGCLLGCLVGSLVGCLGGSGPRTISNEDPAIKIPLIRTAVERGDRSVMPQLVSDLDSEDAAVRFYAIDGLRRLTGEDYGYDWRMDKDGRRPAVEQWRATIGQRTTTTGSATPQPIKPNRVTQ